MGRLKAVLLVLLVPLIQGQQAPHSPYSLQSAVDALHHREAQLALRDYLDVPRIDEEPVYWTEGESPTSSIKYQFIPSEADVEEEIKKATLTNFPTKDLMKMYEEWEWELMRKIITRKLNHVILKKSLWEISKEDFEASRKFSLSRFSVFFHLFESLEFPNSKINIFPEG